MRPLEGESTSRSLRRENIDVFNAEKEWVSTLQRLHFSGWTDKTAIEPETLIDLAQQVVQASGESGKKVLVHCSHGVGRTGTLITFIAASEQIDKLLEGKGELPIEEFTKIVMAILVRGRIERGTQFVSDTQLALIYSALLKKHFDRVEDRILIAKTSI